MIQRTRKGKKRILTLEDHSVLETIENQLILDPERMRQYYFLPQQLPQFYHQPPPLIGYHPNKLLFSI